jgi:hypothetical protein
VFKLFFTNFGYSLDDVFKDASEVKKAAVKHGFQCKILKSDGAEWVPVGTYCPISNFNWL